MQEDNKPHLCVPTLDGNAHVIPTAVFTKIILGEMKITDMEDWEIIVRTAFSTRTGNGSKSKSLQSCC